MVQSNGRQLPRKRTTTTTTKPNYVKMELALHSGLFVILAAAVQSLAGGAGLEEAAGCNAAHRL